MRNALCMLFTSGRRFSGGKLHESGIAMLCKGFCEKLFQRSVGRNTLIDKGNSLRDRALWLSIA